MHQHALAQVSVGSASLELLHQGSAEAFVDALCADALAHPAVQHPYLQRLAGGEFPDMQAAIRDYCHQYAFYCADFPKYLEAVINGLSSAAHRKLLTQNLNEEKGMDPANPEGIPHTELFRRFRRAAGVTQEYDATTRPCTTVLIWRDLFLQKCGAKEVGVGLGGIGIGTEMIVPTVYGFLHRAVTSYTDMTPDDYLFLTLHLDCDDEHADQLKHISIELAEDPSRREALRFGALSSLNLRNAFWDVMLARAVAR
jgi:pyrroloquinoline quinone (PQQ) biosynthesis protein C